MAYETYIFIIYLWTLNPWEKQTVSKMVVNNIES